MLGMQAQSKWIADELAAILKMPVAMLRRKIAFWLNQGASLGTFEPPALQSFVMQSAHAALQATCRATFRQCVTLLTQSCPLAKMLFNHPAFWSAGVIIETKESAERIIYERAQSLREKPHLQIAGSKEATMGVDSETLAPLQQLHQVDSFPSHTIHLIDSMIIDITTM